MNARASRRRARSRISERSAVERVGAHRAAERALHQRLAARVEHQHRGPDQRRERRRERVEPSLGEDDPLEPLLCGQRTAQHRVLLVDELRERRLRDRDERNLVGDLEHRELALGGELDERLRHLAWAKPVPKPSPASWWSASRATNSRWLLGACRAASRSSAAPRRPTATASDRCSSEMWTQRTAGRAPPRPPAGARRALRADRELSATGAHSTRCGRASARPPRSAPDAGSTRSRRTARGPRSAAARAGSRGRHGRRRGRSARGGTARPRGSRAAASRTPRRRTTPWSPCP